MQNTSNPAFAKGPSAPLSRNTEQRRLEEAEMMFLAHVLLPRREMKVREIELWDKHVTPHWGTPEMMQGAVNYHKALIEEGLDNSTMEEIEAFYGTKGQEQKAQ